MMQKIFCLVLLAMSTIGYAQLSPLNLDFETVKEEKPTDWKDFGSRNYTISIDQTVAQNGKTSAAIFYDGNAPDFRAWALEIPARYQGEKIKLTGYLKTENVSDGFAGLWMRIDPSVGFDNMENRGVTGTTDWQQFEVELDLKPDVAGQIVVGGLLVGKGKMWLDNLAITIDGKPIEEAPLKALRPAEKDHEFDKGSNITIPELTAELGENLELLGKVWGFLKYHHPAIGKGDYNWDYELFRLLPNYLKVKDETQRDALLVEWIESLGPLEDCTTCVDPSPNAFAKPDLAWMENRDLSDALKSHLQAVRKNRHQGKHFYISMNPNIGNPVFEHEDGYRNMPYPDDGFRLLALYKYWNMIHYFFPYKHLMDKDWNVNLKAYLPKFLQAKNELEYELAAVQIIGDIQDTHANLWGGNNAIKEWKGNLFPPVHTRFIENKLVVVDYYDPALQKTIGLEIGDVITKVNGQSVEDWVKEKTSYYPASNQPTRLRDMSACILLSNETTLPISYSRKGKEMTMELPLYNKNELDRYRWYPPAKEGEKCYKMLEDNIGYVTLKNIKSDDIVNIKSEFKNAKGIIVDIRNYPSTFVVFSLGNFFRALPSEFVKFTQGDVNNPGVFTFTPPMVVNTDPAGSYKGKVVILVNELSQSQAEYTTMAFRAGDNTTVIGSTTAGADGNVSRIALPGGLRTMISGIGVYYPDGTETQRVGIVPDIECHPTIDGIKNGRDELLEKAIEVIKK